MSVAVGARVLVTVAACAMFSTTLLAGCATSTDGSGGTSEGGEPTSPSTASTPDDTETAPTTTAEPETPGAALPPELVGAWCGGSDQSAHDTWIFEADGTFAANEQVPLSGVAQLRDSRTLVLHTNEIGVQEREIAMDEDTPVGDVLYLDGFSYLRGEC